MTQQTPITTTILQTPTICQTCPQLQQLKQQLQTKDQEIAQLKKTLLQYDNPHTPPSKQTKKHYPTQTNPNKQNQKRFPGPKKDHKGQTRPKPKTPTITKQPPQKTTCTHCHTPLNQPIQIKHHIIEELPARQKKQVIDYLEYQYQCPACKTTHTSRDPQCPPQGIFGVNALVQTTLLKFNDRLPFEKTAQHLSETFDLDMTPATVLDITNRVSQALQPNYQAIIAKIRTSPIVNIDETSIKIDGKKWWIWGFVTGAETLYVIEPSRGKKVLEQVLGKDFSGYIGCDGLGVYVSFSKKLQRCWAHLLREAKWLSEHYVEAGALYAGLGRLFLDLRVMLEGDPSLEVRKKILRLGRRRLRYWLNKSYSEGAVGAFVEKIWNGYEFWFTFVLVGGLDPTNNVVERALREMVVQRKIMGTLRNLKGTDIYETLMTLIVTWKKQGFDLHDKMAECLVAAWSTS